MCYPGAHTCTAYKLLLLLFAFFRVQTPNLETGERPEMVDQVLMGKATGRCPKQQQQRVACEAHVLWGKSGDTAREA